MRGREGIYGMIEEERGRQTRLFGDFKKDAEKPVGALEDSVRRCLRRASSQLASSSDPRDVHAHEAERELIQAAATAVALVEAIKYRRVKKEQDERARRAAERAL